MSGERSYSERDVALLVRCPKCRANPGSLCLNEWASGNEPLHDERRAACRSEVLRLADMGDSAAEDWEADRG